MSPIDTINRVINMVSLVILLFYIVKTYRQVCSLDFLDYFVLYLKHRQTIYDEMQRNPQMRQKQLLSLFVSLMILTFWVIGSLEKLMTAWNLGNLINALIVLWLFGYFFYQTWQNKYLNEQNRYLTFANHFQQQHFNDVMAIFQRKLTAWSGYVAVHPPTSGTCYPHVYRYHPSHFCLRPYDPRRPGNDYGGRAWYFP